MARTCSIFRGLAIVLPAAVLVESAPARGDSQLLYFEAQAVGGYSSLQRKPIYYSMNPDAEMQKPGIGFDYLRRFSGESGDWGSLAFQERLAVVVDEKGERRLEPQAYNAWLKAKTSWTDVWIGHNRPAFGLGSYFDSHALILRTLAIQGFGYDRDWGVGSSRDFPWGNLQLSATTGSGMPVLLKGNYMLAGRVSYGVLAQENFTVGFSAGYGRTLDTMGYKLRDPDPRKMRLLGADFAILRNNLEHRFDLLGGEWLDRDVVAAMYRLGILLDPEGRLKVEVQPTWWWYGWKNWLLSGCISAIVVPDLTVRAMYEYNRDEGDHRAIAQLYYYKPL